MLRRYALSLLVLAAALTPVSCATVQQFANLAQVRFSLDDVQGARLAGVSLDRIRRYEDLGFADLARLTAAAAQGELPLRMTILVGAENPQGNGVTAKMLKLDYTLLLDDKETISGTVNDEFALPAGGSAQIPVTAEVDLVKFFGRNTRQIVDLALALGGQEGVTSRLKVIATPTVQTPLGPIRYPRPITIVSREVGNGG